MLQIIFNNKTDLSLDVINEKKLFPRISRRGNVCVDLHDELSMRSASSQQDRLVEGKSRSYTRSFYPRAIMSL